MDAAQVNDQQRTARAFISFLGSAFGTDQSYAQLDGYAVNQPRQYQTIGPGGLVGVEGTSQSNGQKPAAMVMSPVLLLALAAAAYFLLKK
jgi:hypothetical protein